MAGGWRAIRAWGGRRGCGGNDFDWADPEKRFVGRGDESGTWRAEEEFHREKAELSQTHVERTIER
jgi:hypothetical protein